MRDVEKKILFGHLQNTNSKEKDEPDLYRKKFSQFFITIRANYTVT